MKINIEEIKESIGNLNPKTPYNWPFPIKLGLGFLVFLIVFILGFSLMVIPEQNALEKAEKEELTLKQDFIENKNKSINLDLYKKQLEEVKQASDTLLKQLPNKSDMEKLLFDINQTGLLRGLTFELFKPEKEIIKDFYAELPVRIQVVGSYEDMGKFTADVADMPRVVLLTDMKLSKRSDNMIVLDGTIKTYRYLDQQELDRLKAEKEALENKNKKNKSKTTNKQDPKVEKK